MIFFFIPTSNPLLCTLFFLQLVITKRLRHVTVHPPLRQVSQRKSPGLPDRGLWLLQSETRVSVTKKKKICGAIWRLMGDFVSFSRFVYILPPRRKTLLLFFFYFFPGQERGRHAAYDAGRQASQNTAGPSRTDWRPAGVWLLGQRSDQRCRQYGLFAPLPRSDPPLRLLQRRNHQPPRSVFILKRIKKPHTRFNLTDKHFRFFPIFIFGALLAVVGTSCRFNIRRRSQRNISKWTRSNAKTRSTFTKSFSSGWTAWPNSSKWPKMWALTKATFPIWQGYESSLKMINYIPTD